MIILSIRLVRRLMTKHIAYRCLTGSQSNPYSEYKFNMEVHILVQAAEENLRPTIPESCPKQMKELIRDCWNPDPRQRPNVHQVIQALEAMEQDYFNNALRWENTRTLK